MKRIGLAVALGVAALCAGYAMMKDTGGAMKRGYKVMTVNGTKRPYLVYVPADYTPNKAWPLMVFLHGAGERGNHPFFLTFGGLPSALRRYPERFPCLVVMPQCPKDRWWDEIPEHIDTALAAALKDYCVDRSRIYLTGLSMGGFGTWMYGAMRTDVYAALLPICGGGHPADAAKLATRPIWAFHGADDDMVPPQRSREMVEAVRNVKGNVRYTEFPGMKHNISKEVYCDPNVIEWLLKQHK